MEMEGLHIAVVGVKRRRLERTEKRGGTWPDGIGLDWHQLGTHLHRRSQEEGRALADWKT